jgi:hypothetical protein
MSVELLAVRAALDTISGASCNSLVSNLRELYQANAAIAEALLSLSLTNVQAQPHATLEVDTTQNETQGILQRYKTRRDRPEHALVRLAQYWIHRKLTGSSSRNISDADEHRLLVDLRKAVISSTPALLAMLRGTKRKRSIDGT